MLDGVTVTSMLTRSAKSCSSWAGVPSHRFARSARRMTPRITGSSL